MRNIVLTLIPLFGVALAKAEAKVVAEKTEMTQITTLLGPGKNYRAQLARSYFGSGSKCRNWKRFCGR